MKRHEADATSLVFGLLFLALVTAWGLGYAGLLQGRDLALLAPAALIGAGAVGLVVSLRRSRRAAPEPYGDIDNAGQAADETLVLGDDDRP